MAVIQVETPDGIKQVEIAGETPTTEEEEALFNTFFAEQSPTQSPTQPSTELDFATATIEEIQQYNRAKTAKGVDPLTGGQISEADFVSTYKEPGVDYKTGVDNVEGFSRFSFGNLENNEEKKAYLNDVVGGQGYREDLLGRLILTQQGRQTLGMGEGPDVAFDEEGLTTGDVKDFIGAAGLPIAASIGTALMTSGIGFVPGALLTGAAAITGKAIDEAAEYFRGYQRQSPADVAYDVAMEGVYSLFGDVVGRGISAGIGRVVKGAPGEAAEAQRAGGRALIEREIRPTIGGATSEGFRPILNRLQAVKEGVFPNESAAQENLRILLDELKSTAGVSNISEEAINNLGSAARRKIKERYASESDLLTGLQKQVDLDIEKEIGAIIAPLRKGLAPTEDIFKRVNIAKQNFEDTVDRLYTKVSKNLGDARFIPVSGIRKAFNEVVENDPVGGQTLRNTDLNKYITSLEEKGGATIKEITNLRKSIYKVIRDPSVIAGVDAKGLQTIQNAISGSVRDMEGTLAKLAAVDRFPDFSVGSDGVVNNQAKQNLIKSFGLNVDEETLNLLKGLDKKVLAASLGTLRRTNTLYKRGNDRFNNGLVRTILNEVSKKNGRLSTDFVYNTIIKDGDAASVDMLMKAVRGAPETALLDVGESRRLISSQKIGGKSVDDARAEVANLPENDQYRRFVEREALRIEKEVLEKEVSIGKGGEIAEVLRQKLLSRFITDAVESSKNISSLTGLNTINGKALSAQLTSKGAAIDSLLGPQKKQFNEMVDALSRSDAEVSPEVLQGITKGDLLSSIRGMKELEKTKKIMANDQIRRKLSSGDLNQITDTLLKAPNAARVAKDILGEEVFEQAKDASMGRIIQQIGGTVTKEGKIELSGDFFQEFSSGRLGKKLNKVLSGYGKEHIDGLFGANTYTSLISVSEDMISASNAAIAGKGGLAAPTIATSLGFMAYLVNPIAAATVAASYLIASRALRNPTVLKAMLSSRKKNKVSEFFAGKLKSGDAVGQGYQAAWQIATLGTGAAIRGTAAQTKEEVDPFIEMSKKTAAAGAQKAAPVAQQILPAVQSGLQNLNPFSPAPQSTLATSPIVNPNPTTQALAQQLQGRPK
tara:strand:- start:58 stop:3381 length:3324 start_codon:yes stop_codon:yes gene_type:complete